MMGRIRTIKPEFFLHEGLFDLERETGLPIRVAFAGLWCQCDREGRFEWRPRRLKSQVLPYDDVDFSRVLDALATRGFILAYTESENKYGWIPGFSQHQVVNNREKESVLPAPPQMAIKKCDETVSQANETTSTRAPRVPHACPTPLMHAQAEREREREREREVEREEDESSRVDHINSLSKNQETFLAKGPGDADGAADADDDGGGEFSPEQITEIKAAANRKFRHRGLEPLQRNPADRELAYKLAALMVLGRLPEAAINDGLEAIQRHNGSVSNPAAYLQSVIRKWLCENNQPESLNKLLACVKLPDGLVLPRNGNNVGLELATVGAEG